MFRIFFFRFFFWNLPMGKHISRSEFLRHKTPTRISCLGGVWSCYSSPDTCISVMQFNHEDPHNALPRCCVGGKQTELLPEQSPWAVSSQNYSTTTLSTHTSQTGRCTLTRPGKQSSWAGNPLVSWFESIHTHTHTSRNPTLVVLVVR